MNLIVLPASTHKRSRVVSELRDSLIRSGKTIAQAIADKDLYFRVSLVGGCNLSCAFCHNEGAPLQGRMEISFAIEAIAAAAQVGFTRVQFTGGEPLLHPQVSTFVRYAKEIVADVGVTTNGTFLQKNIESLLAAGLTRVHISLQVESLLDAGRNGAWGIPRWLSPMLDHAAAGRVTLRLNMPVPADALEQAKDFLKSISHYGCDLKVFSILPEGESQGCSYPLEQLGIIVDQENIRRSTANLEGRVFLRSYRPPVGFRCKTCGDFARCKEQSHSLRLGADRILRPCLATRAWDAQLRETDMMQQISEAALLALDF